MLGLLIVFCLLLIPVLGLAWFRTGNWWVMPIAAVAAAFVVSICASEFAPDEWKRQVSTLAWAFVILAVVLLYVALRKELVARSGS